MRKFMIAALLLAMAPLTMAQVHKCKDAAGNHLFSDRPCDAVGGQGKQVQRGRTSEEVYQERVQANDAIERKYQRRAAEREQQAFDQQMESTRQQQVNQTRPEPQRQSDTAACTKAKAELEYVSSIRTIPLDEKRLRTNAAISNVNAACGSNTQLMQEPPKVKRNPPMVTNCDSINCYDDQGGIFVPAGPNLMTGPNGRTCHRAGTMWNCN